LDACARRDEQLDDEAAALERAEHLVGTASARLQAQDEQLESLYGLVECLVELGSPLAVVDGTTVRAWSSALEVLTGVRTTTAVGAALDRVLPSLRPTEAEVWSWTDRTGAPWTVDVRQGGPRLRVLRWASQVEAAEGSAAVSA
jgi:hypothetical protein